MFCYISTFIYRHKAWDHFLLLLGGQSRASNAVIEVVPTLFYLLVTCREQGGKYKSHEMLS